jgi:hypothetical protein
MVYIREIYCFSLDYTYKKATNVFEVDADAQKGGYNFKIKQK